MMCTGPLTMNSNLVDQFATLWHNRKILYGKLLHVGENSVKEELTSWDSSHLASGDVRADNMVINFGLAMI